jgi:hypothetical protein
VLGAAFKPFSDDVRDSPALDVARILHGMGAQVTVYDPAALANAQRACPDLGYADSVAGAAQDAQVVLLLTEWPEFTRLAPGSLGGMVARRNIVDGRNVLDPAAWRDAGWNYRALGVANDPVTLEAFSHEAERPRAADTAVLIDTQCTGRRTATAPENYRRGLSTS